MPLYQRHFYLQNGMDFLNSWQMDTEKQAHFFCGTSNVVLPVPNKGHFPPEYQEKSRLCYYASIFNSVEVNSSFYKIPQGRTVERWATEVPEGFRFTFKLSRDITHAKELIYDPTIIPRFMDAINRIGDKKGCLLVQFPGSIKASFFQRLKKLLGELHTAPQIEEWNLAIEFRDSSWYKDSVYQLLEQYKAGIVVQDMPKCRTPDIDMESSFLYLRFHGERGDYRGSYEEDVLQDYSYVVSSALGEDKDVYAYFNNTMGSAVHNAMGLKEIVLG